jgi:hypothetical protein
MSKLLFQKRNIKMTSIFDKTFTSEQNELRESIQSVKIII